MRDSNNVFHLAIPSHDLDATHEFYVGKLECREARRYDDRITLDFFGDQVVCHLCPEGVDPDPKMYPRHFGITFKDREDYDRVLELARRTGCEFFQEPSRRFVGRGEEHHMFFLKDPSNNLLEFKHYLDPEMMY